MNVKIPYALIAAVAPEQRHEHAKLAIARGLPRLQRQLVDPSKTLHIAAYGPSLRHSFETLRGKHPIMAMSGATKWLAERGIIADYTIECDPRTNKAITSLPPVHGVHYLVASCVCPEYFDALAEAGNQVTLWHTVNSNWDEECAWVATHDPDQLVVHPGSTVGLAAIHVGGVLGFNRFEIHGMCGSFEQLEDGTYIRHAGHHGGKTQKHDVTWNANRKTYYTSKIMANAVAESVNTAKNFPIITIWHGEGLTQALIRKADLINACCADETEKLSRLVSQRPRVVTMQAPKTIHAPSFWETVLGYLQPSDLPELVANIGVCEPRRALAKYNTGSIPFEAAAYLRAISRLYQPEVVVEIGTFIGTSTLALNPGRVIYTCDRSNDCMPSRINNSKPSIVTHPYRSSTQMLAEIQEPVDLFFFDGRIQLEDLPHIDRLRKPSTVFVTDDYTGNEKGVANVALLMRILKSYAVMTPPNGLSTLAVVAPMVQQVEAAA